MTRDEPTSKRPRSLHVFLMLFLVIVVLIASAFLADYVSLRGLVASGKRLRIGMTTDDVRRAIGEPHASGIGWFGDSTTQKPDDPDDVVWEYQMMFDWDGNRSRWSTEKTAISYWWNRLSPVRDYQDEALTI